MAQWWPPSLALLPQLAAGLPARAAMKEEEIIQKNSDLTSPAVSQRKGIGQAQLPMEMEGSLDNRQGSETHSLGVLFKPC